jgi:hypothetical protein
MADRPSRHPFGPPEAELPRLASELRLCEVRMRRSAREAEERWRAACAGRSQLRRLLRAVGRFLGVRHA